MVHKIFDVFIDSIEQLLIRAKDQIPLFRLFLGYDYILEMDRLTIDAWQAI